MKKHQFEEITMSISIVICLLSYYIGIDWLYYIFFVKSFFDFYCAIKASLKSAKKSIDKKHSKQLKETEKQLFD